MKHIPSLVIGHDRYFKVVMLCQGGQLIQQQIDPGMDSIIQEDHLVTLIGPSILKPLAFNFPKSSLEILPMVCEMW